MKLVLNSYTGKVACPHCGYEVTGWMSDPRGAKDAECDECGKQFDIPEDIEIVVE